MQHASSYHHVLLQSRSSTCLSQTVAYPSRLPAVDFGLQLLHVPLVCVSNRLTASLTFSSPPCTLTILATLVLPSDRTSPPSGLRLRRQFGQSLAPSLFLGFFVYKDPKSESRFLCTRTSRTLFCGRPTPSWANHFFLVEPTPSWLEPNLSF